VSGLSLRQVGKSYGSITAVSDVDLELSHGNLVCLLGPSGCGKTTLLRLIAGLEAPTSGRIELDGQDLTATPAHQRGFGMVFQSLALFPHLTVGENIGYALRIRNVDKAARRRRTEELLQLVRLPGVEDRPISQLSGGQRQRVAIARALALDPRLFLLDEPLSALDAKLREAMQLELLQLQRRLGITTIVVTHDQREAMTMADIVVVMSRGQVQQVGAPLEIYRNPVNTFVADFIGSTNLLDATVSGADQVRVGTTTFKVARLPRGLSSGDRVRLSVRPEQAHLLTDLANADNRLPGEITFIRDLGSSIEITVGCGELELLALTTPKERPAAVVGDRVMVQLTPEACVVLAS